MSENLLKGIQIDDEIEYELLCESLAERYINEPDHEMPATVSKKPLSL